MRLNKSKIVKNPDSVSNPEGLLETFDYFQVVSVTAAGAFMDWGFEEDLFVPIGMQKRRLKKGDACPVFIYREKAGGPIIASSAIENFLYDECPPDIREGDTVDVMVCWKTDLGYKAVVNNTCWGLLYGNEVFQPLDCGQRVSGFVKQIRPDGRVDLFLHRPGHEDSGGLAGKILAHLESAGGRSSLSDSTSPEEIYRLFGVSKKKFKMAIGNLYKRRLVVIGKKEIRRVKA